MCKRMYLEFCPFGGRWRGGYRNICAFIMVVLLLRVQKVKAPKQFHLDNLSLYPNRLFGLDTVNC